MTSNIQYVCFSYESTASYEERIKKAQTRAVSSMVSKKPKSNPVYVYTSTYESDDTADDGGRLLTESSEPTSSSSSSSSSFVSFAPTASSDPLSSSSFSSSSSSASCSASGAWSRAFFEMAEATLDSNEVLDDGGKSKSSKKKDDSYAFQFFFFFSFDIHFFHQ